MIAVGHEVGGANTELALQIAKDHPTKCELFSPNSRVSVYIISSNSSSSQEMVW